VYETTASLVASPSWESM